MLSTLAPLLVLVFIFAVLVVVLGGGKSRAADWQFKRRRLLTDNEAVAFNRLVTALPGHRVFVQVAMSQLVTATGANRRSLFNRISQLVADFVVCDPAFNVVAVIELDGRSHDGRRQQAADSRKEKALVAAGVKLVRWNAAALPGADAMRTDVLGA